MSFINFIGKSRFIGAGNGGKPSPPVNTTLDLDFSAGEFDSRIFFLRNSAAWLDDGTEFSVGEPRLVPGQGLLVEEARQNLVSDPATPANQTVQLTEGIYIAYILGSGDIEPHGVFSVDQAQQDIDVSITGEAVWMNLQQGEFETTPILAPIAGSNRDAEVANVAVSSFDYSPTTGMLVVEFRRDTQMQDDDYATVVSLHDGTTNNEIRIQWGQLLDYVEVVATSAGVQEAFFSLGVAMNGQSHKLAVAYDGDHIYGSLNGAAAVSSDAGITLPQGIAALELGGNPSGQTILNGWLSRVTYHPTAPSLADIPGYST